MAENFYLDCEDLKFVMEQMVDWPSIVKMKETIGSEDCPFSSADEARSSYLDMLKDPIGALAAERIAPRAEEVDRIGCTYENGTVTFPDGLNRNIQDLKDAQLMGLTLPREYGGLQFPETVYTAATEMISRADASLMNYFGLSGGIAETIAWFASKELKEKYLPPMASGEKSGAMALTEADAGSDLAAVQTRGQIEASLDPLTGEWKISGTKRFITNGCGDVILVLARSEDPKKYSGGRGLSFFLVEKGPKVKVRRIEHKLGIHGSPTCELYFDEAPAYLIGQRGRGLTRYTTFLMLAARLAVGAQALGICEAAVKQAKKYAEEREQFGKKIRQFPQVAAMLADMEIYTEAARALLYKTSEIVDLNQGAEEKQLPEAKKYGKLAEALTPMAKYYSTELANKVAYQAIQIHGGSGFTKEYPVERLYRDARITNIYEGTSQIQINWAILRVLKGDLDELLAEYAGHAFADKELAGLQDKAKQGLAALQECVALLKDKDTEYRDLVAPHVVDIACDVLVSFLLLAQAEKWEHKKTVVTKFLRDALPRIRMNVEYTKSAQLPKL